MPYLNNIPTADQRLRDSQPDLLENFACINDLLGVDHIIDPWTSPATGNQGKHNKVTLPEQADDPATAANEIALYTKAVAGVTQLFLQPEGVAATTDGRDITSVAWAANQGSTMLPSGLILKWGTGTTPAGGSLTVAFTSAFNTIYMAQASIAAAAGTNANGAEDASVRIYTYDATQLLAVTYQVSDARARLAAPFHWFAIGV